MRVQKSITTTMEMINGAYMGRAKALEKGLDWALQEVPNAEFVTITVWQDIDDPTDGAPEDANYDYTEGGMW